MAAFGEERERQSGMLDSTGNRLLTEAQQQWVRTYQIAQASEINPRVTPPGGWKDEINNNNNNNNNNNSILSSSSIYQQQNQKIGRAHV